MLILPLGLETVAICLDGTRLSGLQDGRRFKKNSVSGKQNRHLFSVWKIRRMHGAWGGISILVFTFHRGRLGTCRTVHKKQQHRCTCRSVQSLDMHAVISQLWLSAFSYLLSRIDWH
jgi:hypothetical protein